MTATLRVAVFFGGRSVEHEVSVITAHEVMERFPEHWQALPVYIAKDGGWYCGDALSRLENFADVETVVKQATAVFPALDTAHRGTLYRRGGGKLSLHGDHPYAQFDIAFPVVHGSHGEDGTLQGLFELMDVPYVGCGVTAAALGMDKPLSRRLFRAAGLPVLEDAVVQRSSWRNEKKVVQDTLEHMSYPLYVKPASLGSSIGVSRVEDAAQLAEALEVAFSYDSRAVVEPAQDDIVEINCSVLGIDEQVEASVCEQPSSTGLLSYADKYAGGGKKGGKRGGKSTGPAKGMAGSARIIPAPIPEELSRRIQNAAKQAFLAIGAAGVARVDFLVRPGSGWFVVNEINTMPGALSFYLWEPSGVSFPDLLERLVSQAQIRAHVKRESAFSIDDWLLRGAAGGAPRAER
jgi:D-alanine-D-alanine ligase